MFVYFTAGTAKGSIIQKLVLPNSDKNKSIYKIWTNHKYVYNDLFLFLLCIYVDRWIG